MHNIAWQMRAESMTWSCSHKDHKDFTDGGKVEKTMPKRPHGHTAYKEFTRQLTKSTGDPKVSRE